MNRKILLGTVAAFLLFGSAHAQNISVPIAVNLTGPITSSGNVTAIAAQTGTGSVFVVQNTPTLTTPVIGAATGTSINLSGTATAGSFIPTSSTQPVNGMWAPTATSVSLGANSTLSFTINSTGTITYSHQNTGLNSASYALSSGAASATSPTLSPNKADGTTGIGAQAAGNISLIAAGVEQVRVAANVVLMPTLASSSAPTTGTVCWTTGTGNLTVDTTLGCLSSTIKVKQDVKPLFGGLKEVMALEAVSYTLKPKYDPEHLGPQVGLIAEQVKMVDPRLVGYDSKGDLRGVRYMQLTAVLVKAIQEQEAEIKALTAEVSALKSPNYH